MRQAFFKSGATMLGIGSSLVDEKLVQAQDFAEIERRAQLFAESAQTNK